MSKLLFTKDRTKNSIGYIGGGVSISNELWPLIPNKSTHQTHLCTLFPSFFRNGSLFENKNISIFISVEKHKLGGVKESVSSKYTVNQKNDLNSLSERYSQVLVYDYVNNEELSLSEIVLEQKYFEFIEDTSEYLEEEHEFFEENGMGLDISKQLGIPYFEQDKINPGPKYQFYMQLLEEDIESEYNIFQRGIGYFYLDRNLKKLKTGDDAGLFFIQNS